MRKNGIRLLKYLEEKNNHRFIFILEEKIIIESASFVHNNIIHLCVSSQAGCQINCKHCATTYKEPSFYRNLFYFEINYMIEIILSKMKYQAKECVLSLSGHGEPLLNFNNVMKVINSYQYKFNKIFVTTILPRKISPLILKEKLNG